MPPKTEIICKICEVKFLVKRSRSKTAKFCSIKCRQDSMIGHRPFNYKGGRLIHKGYIYVLKKNHPSSDRDGYVLEHRLVMEKSLDRFLNSKEIVHHINQNRADNRLENLRLIESQSVHFKEHLPKILAERKLAWAKRKLMLEAL